MNNFALEWTKNTAESVIIGYIQGRFTKEQLLMNCRTLDKVVLEQIVNEVKKYNCCFEWFKQEKLDEIKGLILR